MAEASDPASHFTGASAHPSDPRPAEKLIHEATEHDTAQQSENSDLTDPGTVAEPLEASVSTQASSTTASSPAQAPKSPEHAYGTMLSGPHNDGSSPFQDPHPGYKQCTSLCLLRIKRDVKNLLRHPPEGVHVYPDPDDMTKVVALLVCDLMADV